MKIALPTNDGTSISEHFGRSAAFLIFEIENGLIKGRELRNNGASHTHAQGACNHHSDEKTDPHVGILATLEGCDAVICAGMGSRAAEALKAAGIQILVTSAGPAEAAVSAHLAGKMAPKSDAFCGCHH